jgi:hypothetical protein
MSKRAEPQDLDDIIVPDIEIAEGWAVSEIETPEDCDDAFSYLMAAVAEIEYRLEMKDLGVVVSQDPTWPPRARRALKYKKAALQLVGHKRGRIERASRQADQSAQDRRLIEHIRASVSPLQFRTWLFELGLVSKSDEGEIAA